MTTVLVVDDEAGMRQTLVDILEGAGYLVSVAADGESALSRLRSEDIDVVLMDIRMPGRDGVSVLHEIGRPPPQVIMMTAYAVEDQLRQATRDAYAVVHKPFRIDYLLDLVGSAAGGAA
jgi:two-component system response regulator FlrC